MGPRIRTGEMVHAASLRAVALQTGRPDTSGALGRLASANGFRLPPLNHLVDEPPLPVEVHHGAWAVVCPDCGTPVIAFEGELAFMCTNCFNMRAGGKWRPIVFPDEREAIEAALLRRLPHQREYRYGELVEDLHRQNAEHGLTPRVEAVA